MRFIQWLALPFIVVISAVLYTQFSPLPLAVAPDSLSAKLLQPGFYQVGSQLVQLNDKTRLIATKKQGNISRKFAGKLWFPMIEDGMVAPGKHPLIIYQPGYGDTYKDVKHTAKLLASKGYLVLSVNSPLPLALRKPQYLLEDIANTPRDITFLLNKLAQWNQSPDTLFYSRINLDKIALIGHDISTAGSLLTGFHPTLKDDRINLIINIAGVSSVFTEDFFKTRPKLPVLNINSKNDAVINYQQNALRLAEHHWSNWIININNGSHTGFKQYRQHTPEFFYDTLNCKKLNGALISTDASWKTPLSLKDQNIIENTVENECLTTQEPPVNRLLQFRITQLALLSFIEMHFADTQFERDAADNYLNQVFSLEHTNAHYIPPVN